MRGKTKQNLTQKQKKKAYAKLTKLKKEFKILHKKFFNTKKQNLYILFFAKLPILSGEIISFLFLLIN